MEQEDKGPLGEGRPLSDAPIYTYTSPDGQTTLRIDSQNRIICHAHRRDGELCKSPAVRGMRVCRMHGGSTGQAKRGAALRFHQLVNPAIATLAKEMAQAEKSVDRQRAANSILDRAGHGRHQVIDAGDAREILFEGISDLVRQKKAREVIDP